MQGPQDDERAPSDAPEPAVLESDPQDREPRADTAVSPVIRGESVSIPTPAWGMALPVDDGEVIVAELVDDDTGATRTGVQRGADGEPLTTATGSILIPEPAPPRPPVLGVIAVLAAITTIVLHALAVNIAAAGDPQQATVLGWAAIAVSTGTIVLGVLSAALHSGRIIGMVAAVVALFANPWILLKVLEFFAP